MAGHDAVFAALLGGDPPDFALLHRPGSGAADRIEILLGTGTPLDRLAGVPLPDGSRTLLVLPYRQLTERGLACHDDGTPLLHLPAHRYRTVSVAEALEALP